MVEKVCEPFHATFDQLLQERAEGLENVGPGQDTNAKLLDIYERTKKTIQKVRVEIANKVLTPQQKHRLRRIKDEAKEAKPATNPKNPNR